MKKRILFLMALTACVMQSVKAEVYLLESTSEKSFTASTAGTVEYTIKTSDAPTGILTFEAKRASSISAGTTYLDVKVNGSWVTKVWSNSLTTSYQSYSVTLDRNATALKFYTGLANGTKSRYFKDVKVTMASYVEVGSQPSAMSTEVGTAITTSFTIAHSNVAQLSVSSSDNALFTPDVTTISESGAGRYGTTTITVTYNPTAAGTHSGIITVSNGTQSVQVSVSGTATKKAQTLTWTTNTVIPVGESLSDAATASSGLEVTLSSSDENVIAVENGQLVAKAAGTATITATQAGTDIWASVSDTKTFTATTKEVQTITWEQDLFRLKTGDAAVTLMATASSGLAVTYTSSDADVVAVSGSTLTIVGVGTATLTATQAGNGTYAAASLEKAVRVREVSTGCDEHTLADNGNYEIMNGLSAGSPKTFDLSKPSDKLSFTFTKGTIALGNIVVTEYYSDGTSSQLCSVDAGSGSKTDVQVSRNATQLKFAATGTMNKNLTGVYVTQASYLETDQSSISFEAQMGTAYTKELKVNYSNLTDIISISHTNTQFTLTNAADFGEGCGDFGSHTVSVGFTPSVLKDTTDTIIITCVAQTLRVPVAVTVVKKTQAISWEQDLSSVLISDTLNLAATVSSGLDVTYTSGNTAVAVILEGGKLAFVGAGSSVITAAQAGNDNYAAAQSMEKTVTVNCITPEISTSPVAGGIIYGQTLAESNLTDGAASVAGTFAWADNTVAPAAGDPIYTVNFTPANTAYYTTTTCNVTLNVAKASQTISWEQDLTALEIGSSTQLTASASSGLDVTYITDGQSFMSLTDAFLSALSAGQGMVTASQAGNENYLAAADVTLHVTVSGGTTTAVNAASQYNLLLYPNPVVDMLHIQGEQIQAVAVYDMNGRLLQKQAADDTKELLLNVSALRTATYILVVNMADGKQKVQSFIKR